MQSREYNEGQPSSQDERMYNSDPRERVQEMGHDYPRERVQEMGHDYPTRTIVPQRPRHRAPWLILLVCVIAIVIAAGIVGLTGGLSFGRQSQALPTRSFSLSGHGSLVINENSGSVHIHGGNTNQIIVKGTGHTTAWIASGTKEPQLQYTQQGNNLTVTADENTGGPFSNSSVDLDITVPENIDVAVHGNSSDVDLADTNGQVTMQVDSGDLTLDQVTGTFGLNVSSGDINVTNESGPLDAHTASGDIVVNGATSTLDLSTSSGDITVHRANLSGQNSFRTVSGDIELAGTFDPRGTYQAQTTSGDITLTLPASSAFQLDATTDNGDVHNDFDSSIVGSAPQASIKLSTTSGDITVRKD